MKRQLFEDEKMRINAVKSFIGLNLDSDLKVEPLSKKFGYSRSTLKRHFQINFDESIHHCILRLRMEAANKLIIGHAAPLSEIGPMVGYDSRSGFTHTFRKYFGYTPSAASQQIHGLTQSDNSLNQMDNSLSHSGKRSAPSTA